MFFAKDIYERTAWLIASKNGQIDVLNKFWEWVNEILTPEELNSMFLDKDGYERAG